jgi:hypothetical protein
MRVAAPGKALVADSETEVEIVDLVDPAATVMRAASDVPVAVTTDRGPEAGSATDPMKVAFHALHASAKSGATAPIGFVTRAGRAATTRDFVSAHGRLDRSHRWGDVQRQERGAHAPR